MKKIKNYHKSRFVKKIFIQICRKIGYEIIDQNNFEIPTLNKKINDLECIGAQFCTSVIMHS